MGGLKLQGPLYITHDDILWGLVCQLVVFDSDHDEDLYILLPIVFHHHMTIARYILVF